MLIFSVPRVRVTSALGTTGLALLTALAAPSPAYAQQTCNGPNVVFGTSGNDSLTGTARNDYANGGAGENFCTNVETWVQCRDTY